MTLPPVVLIHGLWIHSSAWQPWLDLYRAAGYDVHAPGWPGDGPTPQATRANPAAVAGQGVAEITAGYQRFIATLPERPIVVGHSFGGLIAQRLLAEGHAAAAVAIDPAPIRGVKKLPFAQIRSALPVLSNPRNKRRAVMLSERQFRYSFGNALSREESRDLYARFAIPGPGRPLFEVTSAAKNPESPTAVDTHTATRGPLLIIGGGADHTVPEVVAREAYELYHDSAAVTEYHAFPGRGHSLVFDHGWKDVADHTLTWLRENPSPVRAADPADQRSPGSANATPLPPQAENAPHA